MIGKTSAKLRTAIVILLTAIMSLSLAFFVACNKTPAAEKEDDTVYSKVENDEQELRNGNFEFGTADVDDDDFPYTSINGWTRAVDSGAMTSRVNSGIIDTTKWDTLIDTLVKVTEFQNFVVDKYSIDKDELKTAAKEELGDDADSEDIDGFVEKKIAETVKEKFANPGAHDGASGKKIMMLNNYSDQIGKGTAQKITSSETFTLTAGKIAKFSVWIRTAELKPSANIDKYGANVRVITTVASVTQDEYAISNIIAADWTQYTVYVKANDFADTTVRLVLGLGYGADNTASHTENYVEGTVFFDDAAYEELDAMPDGFTQTADKLSLVNESSADKSEAKLDETTHTAYLDMTSENYYENLTFTANTAKTVSNSGTSKMPESATVSGTTANNGFKVEQSKASSTTKVTSDKFIVKAGEYTLVRFKMAMTLDKFQRTGLTVYVTDSYNDEENNQMTLNSLIAEEEDYYTIIIKNNFDKDDTALNGDRKFSLSFIMGPVNVAATADATLYTTGSYEVSEMSIKSGSMDEDSYTDESKNAYAIYSLIGRTSKNLYTLAAYAGFNADYSEDNNDESFTFSAAYSDEGTITHAPANVAGYVGVSDYAVTYNTTHDDKAGLINTKYLDAYNDIQGLKAALNWDGKDNIQPLMINNATARRYGFVNTSSTISANTTATVSVKVRVTASAEAYIYFVDTSRENLLNVINQSFTADDGTEYSNDLFVKVTADMCNKEKSGWVTVNFYIASGDTPISYRLELWNGERTSATQSDTDGKTSTGFVFFDEVNVGTTFDAVSLLDEIERNAEIDLSVKAEYTRKLSDKEIQYNSEQKDDDDKVKYEKSVIWATDRDENGKGAFVMALFGTIDPTETDPYGSDSSDSSDSSEKTGCQGADASALALSISSIVLAVALVAAIVAVVVKAILHKRRANKSDAKSHYKVTSRNKAREAVKARAAKPEVIEEPTDNAEPEEDKPEEEYTYGEVLEDFGDDTNSSSQDEPDEPDDKE